MNTTMTMTIKMTMIMKNFNKPKLIIEYKNLDIKLFNQLLKNGEDINCFGR